MAVMNLQDMGSGQFCHDEAQSDTKTVVETVAELQSEKATLEVRLARVDELLSAAAAAGVEGA